MKTMLFFLVAPFLVLVAWLSTAFGLAATLGASVCVFSFSLPISLFLIGFWLTFGPKNHQLKTSASGQSQLSLTKPPTGASN